jgi:hypothetical protein
MDFVGAEGVDVSDLISSILDAEPIGWRMYLNQPLKRGRGDPSNWKFSFWATVARRRRVWPHAALISFHPTYVSLSLLEWTCLFGRRPSLSPLITPKKPS